MNATGLAPAAITVLSGNLRCGGVCRSRGEQRFPGLMDAVAQQQPDIYRLITGRAPRTAPASTDGGPR